ncbi:MAG: HlyD family type I secretion periplasmic adaptor subunit [Pseudomonadales bacterium]|nr:HlyD family type I secretion periplasmic adaptor subunit [Pseudomonadales bacterium]MDP7595103.1 HlyD family type I secretion periplasmic adaptor subunit [Pseudomonadales bacterium]HJN51305.1 HlyD family type I secretion periplasmic adaptor subunit [Pseudomonadales bacterium]
MDAIDREDMQFMLETAAAEIEALPISLHLILWSSVLFLLSALIWANWATLDELARADGRVIPSSQVQIIQNLEGGILAEVLCRQGDRIDKGDILLRLDDTRFASSYNEGKLSSHALQSLIARLESEVTGTAFVPPADFPAEGQALLARELSLYRSRQVELNAALDILTQQLSQQTQTLRELESEIGKYDKNAQLAEQELALTEPLVETGAVSQVELLRLQVAVNESVGRLDVARLAIPKIESAITEAEGKISERKQQFISDAQAQLNEAKTQFSRLSISNVALQDRVQRTDVRSPVDGTVKQILVNTIGGIIQPGMDLIEIVPANDTLLVEAKIRPSDIAFIHPGQKATVKLTAYDFSIYGGLDSVLELISADTITDERGEHFFQIQVRTNRNYLGSKENPLPIMPGMIASVDILTGKKTVMDYILKPLKRAQASALSER